MSSLCTMSLFGNEYFHLFCDLSRVGRWMEDRGDGEVLILSLTSLERWATTCYVEKASYWSMEKLPSLLFGWFSANKRVFANSIQV